MNASIDRTPTSVSAASLRTIWMAVSAALARACMTMASAHRPLSNGKRRATATTIGVASAQR